MEAGIMRLKQLGEVTSQEGEITSSSRLYLFEEISVAADLQLSVIVFLESSARRPSVTSFTKANKKKLNFN